MLLRSGSNAWCDCEEFREIGARSSHHWGLYLMFWLVDDLLLLNTILDSRLLLVSFALGCHSSVLSCDVHGLGSLEGLLLVLLEVHWLHALLNSLVFILVTFLLLLKTSLLQILKLLALLAQFMRKKALFFFIPEDLGSSLLRNLLKKTKIRSEAHRSDGLTWVRASLACSAFCSRSAWRSYRTNAD